MSDIMIKVLQEIRDELKGTRQDLIGRIDQTNSRLDEANERLDRVERRQTESEVRLATELTAVVGAIDELKDVLIEDRKLRTAVADHEVRLKVLEQRKAG
jgi:chromosome segregation ATPase